METPVKVIVDLSKPEGEREQVVPLTENEIAEMEAMAAQAKKEEAARAKELAAQEAAKASAVEKLAALGLTEQEVKALLG
jgi:hypothetical protein